MTTAKPLARYGAHVGALREPLRYRRAHHYWGRYPSSGTRWRTELFAIALLLRHFVLRHREKVRVLVPDILIWVGMKKPNLGRDEERRGRELAASKEAEEEIVP